MTWDEFKQSVDKQLAEKRVDGSIELWYIDISYPQQVEIMIDKLDEGDIGTLSIS